MQKEVTAPASVFNQSGCAVGGWAKQPFLNFNTNVYKQKQKIDHRQCFFAENEKCALFLSLEKAGIEFIVKIILRDKSINGIASDCIVKKYIFNKSDIPYLLSDSFLYEEKRLKIAVTAKQKSKHLRCQFNEFANFENLYFDLTFTKQDCHSFQLSVPFEKSNKNFFYKSFTPNMLVTGKGNFGDNIYDFNNASGYCDCSSYVLPYRQIYRCVTSSCKLNGENFALYLGSKLGDDFKGEENCYFFKGNIKKLSKVKFIGSDERIDKIWEFKAGINAVDLIFTPDTYKGAPVFSKCDKTTIVYGTLCGEFNLIDCETVNFANIPAQMIYTVI